MLVLSAESEPGRAQVMYRIDQLAGVDTVESVAMAYRLVPGRAVEALRESGVRREWASLDSGGLWKYR